MITPYRDTEVENYSLAELSATDAWAATMLARALLALQETQATHQETRAFLARVRHGRVGEQIVDGVGSYLNMRPPPVVTGTTPEVLDQNSRETIVAFLFDLGCAGQLSDVETAFIERVAFLWDVYLGPRTSEPAQTPPAEPYRANADAMAETRGSSDTPCPLKLQGGLRGAITITY